MGRGRAARRLGPGALLAGILLLLYGPTLLGDRALIGVHTDQFEPWRSNAPEGSVEADALPQAADKTLMFHPQAHVAQHRLQRGEAPLWNPYNLCGVPLLAQGVHGALHPINLLTWWPGAPIAYGWIAALQAWVAALGAFLLARQLGLDRPAAMLAGLAFGLCGYLSARSHWFQIQAASIYLPWVLLGIERAFTGGRAGAVALSGLALGLSWLAGFPQGAVLTTYAGAAWGAIRLVPAWRSDRRTALAASGCCAGALLLGLALGMPQLLPTAALAQSGESTRGAEPPEVIRSLGSRPASLLTLVAPELFGHPRDLAQHDNPMLRDRGVLSRLLQKPRANHVETAATISIAALLLALLGAGTRRRGRGPALGLFLAGGLLALDTPLIEMMAHLPGLDGSDPRRFVVLLAMGGALLAALGLQRLTERGAPRWFGRTVGVFALLAAATAAAAFLVGPSTWIRWVAPGLAAQIGVTEPEVLAHADDLVLDLILLRRSLVKLALLAVASAIGVGLARRRRSLATGVLLAAAAAELVFTASRAVTALPAEGFFRPPPALALLATPGAGRLARFQPGSARNPLAYPLPPNTGLPFGVRDLSGYITLAPRRLEALHERLQPGSATGVGIQALTDPGTLTSPLLQAMAVDRVLSSVPLQQEGLTLVGPVGGTWLYRTERALPRAYLVREGLTVHSEAEALTAISRDGYDPRLATLVELPSGPVSGTIAGFEPDRVRLIDAGGAEVTVPARPPIGTVSFLQDDPELVVLRVQVPPAARGEPAGGLLVLVDSFMPGWQADVDGAPVEIRAANVAFRAVPVPAGSHTVTFRYLAPGWEAGKVAGLAGLAGLAACLALALVGRRRRRDGGS